MNQLLIRGLIFLSLSLGFCLYLFFWSNYTGSGPERDAFKFYYPSLSLIYAAIEGLNPWEVIDHLKFPQYPWGYFLIPWIYAILGLSSYVFLNPVFLLFPCAILNAALVVLADSNLKHCFLLSLIIFFLPLTQVSLKGYSPHSFCVFLPFIGSLLIFQNFRGARIIAWLAFFFAGGFKHLGLLNTLIICCSTVLVLIESCKENRPFIASNFLLTGTAAFASLIFYEHSSGNNYSELLLMHFHQTENLSLGMFSLIVSIALSMSLLKLKKFYSLERLFPNEIKVYTLAYIIFIPWSLTSLHSIDTGIQIVSLHLVFLVRLLLIKNHIKEKLMMICFVLSSLIGSLLFASGMGGTFYLFHLPCLFLIYLLILKSDYFPFLLLITFFLFSNFFIKNDQFEKYFGDNGKHFIEKTQEGIYNSFWSWYKSPTMQIQKGFAGLVESFQINDRPNMAVLDANLKVDLRTIALYHRNLYIHAPDVYPLDAAATESLDTWWNSIRSHGFQKSCDKFFKGDEFSIILEGVSGGYQSLEFKNLTRDNLASQLGKQLLDCYRSKENFESKFSKLDLPEHDPLIRIWHLRSSKASGTPKNKHLQDLIIHLSRIAVD